MGIISDAITASFQLIDYGLEELRREKEYKLKIRKLRIEEAKLDNEIYQQDNERLWRDIQERGHRQRRTYG